MSDTNAGVALVVLAVLAGLIAVAGAARDMTGESTGVSW
jgi:hypothetical protein